MRGLIRVVRAFGMAAWGHRKQKDKGGRAYLWHLVTVAVIAFGLTWELEAVVVGLLHDYLEDLYYPGIRTVIYNRFGFGTLACIETLTKPQEVEYVDYIAMIANPAAAHWNPLATIDSPEGNVHPVWKARYRIVLNVKIADLLHNSDGSRRWLMAPGGRGGSFNPEGGVYPRGVGMSPQHGRTSRYLNALNQLLLARSVMKGGKA